MLKLINKFLVTILNLIFGLFILVFLFVITFANTENIYAMNFSDIYTIWYFAFLLIWIIWIIIFRFLRINNHILKEELLYTIKSIFFIAIFLIPSFFMVHNFMFEHLWESNLYLRAYWKITFLYFALAIVITPILRFIKNVNIRDNLILSRKILWVLTFVFFLKHWLEYFAVEYIYSKYNPDISYLYYVYKNIFIRFDALSGVVAWVLMFILWLTSNKISVKLFWWKKWKAVQSLVYPLFLLSVIHIAFASRFDNFYIFLVIFVALIRTISYLSNKTDKNTWKTTKYICVPCWFIYDENIWDPDSWLEPGTKFEDIPDDWYCPVCWVSKSDFEPYYEDNNTVFGWYLWEVVWYEMLTDDVLELSLKVDSDINVLKWQYAIMILKDFDSEFSRAYSIVKSENNTLIFWIKVKDIWRWGSALKNLKLWSTVKIKWIYWEFTLKDNNNPKVFISTGTWLSPIMNMISTELKSKNNYLFFWVKKKKDLFYVDKISNIENIETHILLSREEVEWFESWRIDLSRFDFDVNTEFYICGNPTMVEVNIKYLVDAWFKNIYSERF
jgi:rubredoxin/ferredoxin-NADP reductase